jgi:hypothetical protein
MDSFHLSQLLNCGLTYFQCHFTIYAGINFPYDLWTNRCQHCETLNFDCGVKTTRSTDDKHHVGIDDTITLPLRTKARNGGMAIRQRSYAVSLFREDPYDKEVYDTFEVSPPNSLGFRPWVHSILDFICNKEGLAEDLPEYLDKYIAILESNFDSWNDKNRPPLCMSLP